ncbi:Hypothetical predicted protein [Pelobates cultripes]|uniref:Uncharacterized protein n=1 Tax=Pelobates cultripes TaxID=61616 RepID=A0AAD1WE85_PELCU|nr:Hypothetical predicted protein [Pelobates cultripes]
MAPTNKADPSEIDPCNWTLVIHTCLPMSEMSRIGVRYTNRSNAGYTQDVTVHSALTLGDAVERRAPYLFFIPYLGGARVAFPNTYTHAKRCVAERRGPSTPGLVPERAPTGTELAPHPGNRAQDSLLIASAITPISLSFPPHYPSSPLSHPLPYIPPRIGLTSTPDM